MDAKKYALALTGVIMILALLVWRGAGSSVAPEDTSDKPILRVGYTGSLCEGPLHIAIENGFLAEEGLRVEAVRLAPGTNYEAIGAGKIDASFGLLATLIIPLANGLPIKITTGLHTGCDKILVPGNSAITALGDLRGKRIGVPSLTSSAAIFAKRALAAAGVSVNPKNMEAEFVVFNNSELPLALSRGAVDAMAANDPVASLAAWDYSLRVLLDSAKHPPYDTQYCCAAYVSTDLAETHPEIAAACTRAFQKASAWIQAHPDETARIQVEKNYVAGDQVFNASILKTFNYIPSVRGAFEAFSLTAEELRDIGLLDAKVDIERLRDNSFSLFSDVPDTFVIKD